MKTALLLALLVIALSCSSSLASEGQAPLEFSMEGYVTFESLFSTASDEGFEESNKKNEVTSRLEMRYGGESAYLFLTPMVSMASLFTENEEYRYTNDAGFHENMRYASSSFELSFNELYFHYETDQYRVRAGNQIFGWGTADVFNPTAYFNPIDMRELFFKEEENNRYGVPALSGIWFADRFTTELVWVPVHVPGETAASGNWWSVSPDNYALPVEIDDPESRGSSPSDYGFGTRVASTVSGADFSLSLYHGPDRDPLFLPEGTFIADNGELTVLLEPRHHTASMAGFDFSMAIESFVIQCEAVWSPNKTGYIPQDPENPMEIVFPFEEKKSDYIAFATGFNWFVPLADIWEEHGGETVLTFEWYTSHYADSRIEDPSISDFISVRFEDDYMDGRVRIEIVEVVDLAHTGSLFYPSVTYDFQNGFSIECSYAHFNGSVSGPNTPQSVFTYFRDRDVISLKTKYDF